MSYLGFFSSFFIRIRFSTYRIPFIKITRMFHKWQNTYIQRSWKQHLNFLKSRGNENLPFRWVQVIKKNESDYIFHEWHVNKFILHFTLFSLATFRSLPKNSTSLQKGRGHSPADAIGYIDIKKNHVRLIPFFKREHMVHRITRMCSLRISLRAHIKSLPVNKRWGIKLIAWRRFANIWRCVSVNLR